MSLFYHAFIYMAGGDVSGFTTVSFRATGGRHADVYDMKIIVIEGNRVTSQFCDLIRPRPSCCLC